ncbi:helix-turn-helix domain-containing protein [Methylomagnum ishizawai]|uniref:helix-turn-helix domain-containing protein n=1 Tax=Methylomagnum ishizawai TaxID=1760988 RepID=UPI001C322A12|nr:helix-turn-helix domain-containing protein [Methylomagnum ishizawai]BBL75428.1 hypothetical protein MishRS11D_25260 [Methylomagnum ishizawai]
MTQTQTQTQAKHPPTAPLRPIGQAGRDDRPGGKVSDRGPDIIILDLLARLRARGVEIPPEVSWEVERGMRAEYGNDAVWVGKRPPDLRERIRALLAARVSRQDAARRFGVSKATVRRAVSVR